MAWAPDATHSLPEDGVVSPLASINAHRQGILTFTRECRDNVAHDREEWNHILSVAEEYSVYCKSHDISNGVVKADTEYIRGLYQELSREHKI